MIKKSFISLSDIPDTILGLCLIFGVGSIFGLLVFASFEIEKAKVLEAMESTATEGEYFGNKFILVKAPNKNSSVNNPVFISGMANVYEANVRIRIKENDRVLADTFLTADGAGNALYNFKGNVMFTIPETKNGSIEIFEESPKNGHEAYKVIIPVAFKDYSGSIKWNTFSDNANGYSFEHSSDLTVITNSEKKTIISHKIPHKHADLCIGKYNASENLNDVTDFYVSMVYINDNLLNSIRAHEGITDSKDKKIFITELGGNNAYYVDNAINGCGTRDYFIELAQNKTILLKRQSIPEFIEDEQTYSSLKNIITPAKNDYLFDHMASSIRSIN